MSKSLGNFTTIRALLESGVSPMALRLFVLQAHYRKPLDFTAAGLEAASTGWRGLEAALGLGSRHGAALGWQPSNADQTADGSAELEKARARFAAAMDDDLNSSAALAELFELAAPLKALANRLRSGETAAATDLALEARWRLLVELAGVLGLEREVGGDAGATAAGPGAQAEQNDAEAAAIEALVEQRRAAKAARDFATADRIRDDLRERGIDLVDRPGGVTLWLRR
jgi:cysteinyl-tRNA synthetase